MAENPPEQAPDEDEHIFSDVLDESLTGENKVQK